MDKKTVIDIINRFLQGIEERGIKPLKVILYGSYAKDKSYEGSDIDIIVISEDFAGLDYWERIDIMAEVIYEIFAPIEAVAMTPNEWEKGDSFVIDYSRDGEILFAA